MGKEIQSSQEETAITVGELITELQKHPTDMKIITSNHGKSDRCHLYCYLSQVKKMSILPIYLAPGHTMRDAFWYWDANERLHELKEREKEIREVLLISNTELTV